MSILDTIAAVIFQQMELGEAREQACVIVQTAEGGYYATKATLHRGDNFSFPVHLGTGERIIAIVHTHPANSDALLAEDFSPADKAIADRMKIRSYVYFATLKQIRVYFAGSEHEINRYVQALP